MRIKILAFALAMIFACSAIAEECHAEIYRSKSSLEFYGCISEKSAKEFNDALDHSVTNIVLQSEGGGVSEAIRMAKKIQDIQPRVLIRGLCASSCANYLLPASRRTYVERGALVLFHGDARLTVGSDPGAFTESETARNALRDIVEAEIKFAKNNSRAEVIHLMQVIARNDPTTLQVIRVRGAKVECTGFQTSAWRAPLEVLKEAKLVREIVDRNQKPFPAVRAAATPDRYSSDLPEFNPFSRCR